MEVGAEKWKKPEGKVLQMRWRKATTWREMEGTLEEDQKKTEKRYFGWMNNQYEMDLKVQDQIWKMVEHTEISDDQLQLNSS